MAARPNRSSKFNFQIESIAKKQEALLYPEAPGEGGVTVQDSLKKKYTEATSLKKTEPTTSEKKEEASLKSNIPHYDDVIRLLNIFIAHVKDCAWKFNPNHSFGNILNTTTYKPLMVQSADLCNGFVELAKECGIKASLALVSLDENFSPPFYQNYPGITGPFGCFDEDYGKTAGNRNVLAKHHVIQFGPYLLDPVFMCKYENQACAFDPNEIARKFYWAVMKNNYDEARTCFVSLKNELKENSDLVQYLRQNILFTSAQNAAYDHKPALMTLKAVLNLGFDANIRDHAGRIPLQHCAPHTQAFALLAKHTHPEYVRWVMDQAKIEPIIAAIAMDDLEALKVMLCKDIANLSMVNEKGWTPLHWAAHFNSSKVAGHLLQAGAKVEVLNQDGQLPLGLVTDPSSEVFKLIAERMDQKRAREIQTQFWMNQACVHIQYGQLESVQQLLKETKDSKQAFDIDTQDLSGMTMLHYAAHFDQLKIGEWLLQNKAKQMADFDIMKPRFPLSFVKPQHKQQWMNLIAKYPPEKKNDNAGMKPNQTPGSNSSANRNPSPNRHSSPNRHPSANGNHSPAPQSSHGSTTSFDPNFLMPLPMHQYEKSKEYGKSSQSGQSGRLGQKSESKVDAQQQKTDDAQKQKSAAAAKIMAGK